jgi:hypothetical protein
MPIVIFDTGFLYSLAVDRTYSEAAQEHWKDTELWVPSSVRDEMKYRTTHPLDGLPPELPQGALGIVRSNSWNFEICELTDDEQAKAEVLRQRLGGGPMDNHGESDAAVLVASRAHGATVALDDATSVPVLYQHVLRETGSGLQFVHTTTVLDQFASSGRLSAAAREAIGQALAAKGRPFT